MAGPSITLHRRIQFMDTDAAGIWHYTTIFRLAEEAELELHRRLGINDLTFGVTPRVRIEFDFGEPARFDDPVDLTLAVTEVGRSSARYAITLDRNGTRVATGSVTIAYIDKEAGRSRPWPEEVRAALTSGVPVTSGS